MIPWWGYLVIGLLYTMLVYRAGQNSGEARAILKLYAVQNASRAGFADLLKGVPGGREGSLHKGVSQ